MALRTGTKRSNHKQGNWVVLVKTFLSKVLRVLITSSDHIMWAHIKSAADTDTKNLISQMSRVANS